MRVLVTGGAGYIGSVVVEQLIAADHTVVVFDNLSQGHIAAVHPRADFVEGDLADAAALNRAFAGHKPEAVMHFAANSLVGASMERPFQYLGDNVVNGLNLMRAAIEHGVRRFILSSTANLFDCPERIPIDEDAAISPGSPYGESKFILERMLHWLDRTHRQRSACLRYFNAAGATEHRGEDHRPETHLIPLVLQVARGLRPHVTVFGSDYPTPDGTCVRDYVHVSDIAAAHILALEVLARESVVYNLGNGEGFSVLQVVETARVVTGSSIPVIVAQRRAGDVAMLVAGSAKIRRDLGWKPQYPKLQDILSSAWTWHKRFPTGYPQKMHA